MGSYLTIQPLLTFAWSQGKVIYVTVPELVEVAESPQEHVMEGSWRCFDLEGV